MTVYENEDLVRIIRTPVDMSRDGIYPVRVLKSITRVGFVSMGDLDTAYNTRRGADMKAPYTQEEFQDIQRLLEDLESVGVLANSVTNLNYRTSNHEEKSVYYTKDYSIVKFTISDLEGLYTITDEDKKSINCVFEVDIKKSLGVYPYNLPLCDCVRSITVKR